jgi:uncharacterized protein (UPF0128 family)
MGIFDKNKFDSVKMEKTGLFNADGKELDIISIISMLPTNSINRVEVVDENGRSYVNWKSSNQTKLQIQDEGRTLKVFISQKDIESKKESDSFLTEVCHFCKNNSLYKVRNNRGDASFEYYIYCKKCKDWVGKINWHGEFSFVSKNKIV